MRVVSRRSFSFGLILIITTAALVLSRNNSFQTLTATTSSLISAQTATNWPNSRPTSLSESNSNQTLPSTELAGTRRQPPAPTQPIRVLEPNPIMDSTRFQQHFRNDLLDSMNESVPYCERHFRRFGSSASSSLGYNTIHDSKRLLWFSGFAIGENAGCSGGGYKQYYATALRSARRYASDALQPILLLGGNNITTNKFANWAKNEGAIVLHVEQLSFHDAVQKGWHGQSPDHLMGPFLRLDIPTIIRRHNLFELENVHPEVVLYTDADVLFVNNITRKILATVVKGVLPPKISYLMYGREARIADKLPINTGVMFMNVARFEQEFSKILEFGYQQDFNFGAYDQGWLNEYFAYNTTLTNHHVTLLPLYWNWKVYWKLAPSKFEDLRIVHFHGPKVGKGLEAIGGNGSTFEDITHFEAHGGKDNEGKPKPHPYFTFILTALMCDQGRTARRVLEIMNELVPHLDNYCR